MKRNFFRKTGAVSKLLFFCACFSVVAQAQAQLTNLTDGVYTAEQASEGAELYQRHCVHCHDDQFFKDSLVSWTGMTVLDYWYRILGNMPADKPKSLKDSEYLAIVAWVLSINAFPAGSEPLAPSNYLGRLKIEGLE